jgi:HAD superfamily hydrolase (TIGR01509 family)
VRGLARLRTAERAKRDKQRDRADCEHRTADREHRRHDVLKLWIHMKERSTPDAVIFDFDETIIDLEPQHTAAHAALCRDLGCDYAEMPESFRRGSGRRIIDDIRDMRAFFGWIVSEAALFRQRQVHFDLVTASSTLEPIPGVLELLRHVAASGVPMAITSSAVASSIEPILLRLGIRPLFSLIVDGSEVERGKPDPEAYLVTARKLGVAPARCIVFEDSTVGVLAAKRAGMFTVGVPNARAQERQDLSAADLVFGSMRDVTLQSLGDFTLSSATRRMS